MRDGESVTGLSARRHYCSESEEQQQQQAKFEEGGRAGGAVRALVLCSEKGEGTGGSAGGIKGRLSV